MGGADKEISRVRKGGRDEMNWTWEREEYLPDCIGRQLLTQSVLASPYSDVEDKNPWKNKRLKERL